MILAGDIGGTKSNLGLFELKDGRLRMVRSAKFRSSDFSGLSALIEAFLSEDEAPGSVGNRGMGRPSGSTGDRELAEVNAVCLDRRAASRDDSVRQAPAMERFHP